MYGFLDIFVVENISLQKNNKKKNNPVCKAPHLEEKFEHEQLILALYSSILHLHSNFS